MNPSATYNSATDNAMTTAEVSQIALQDRAFQQMQSKDWQGAAATYAQIVRLNPYCASHWFNFGYTLHKTARYSEAVPAFQQAITLGFGFDNKLWWRYIYTEEWWRSLCPRVNAPWYMLTRAYALHGQKEEALQALSTAMENGFADETALKTEPDLDLLRNDPDVKMRFDAMLGVPPEDLSREARWRFDLDWMVRRLEQIHYAPYRQITRPDFLAEIQRLKERLPDWTDTRIVMEIMRVLALVGDGHTGLHWRNKANDSASFSELPVALFPFADGVFVVRARASIGETAGGRVLRVGDHPIEEVLKAMERYCSMDNTQGYVKQVAQLAICPEFLEAAGFITDTERIPVVVEQAGGQQICVELNATPTEESWVYNDAQATVPAPFSLNNHDTLWFETWPDRPDIAYCQCNGIGDASESETWQAFFHRLFATIEAKEVDYLALDLRYNCGGDSGLNQALLHAILRCARIHRRGHFFVLIGRWTFSAAQNLTTQLEHETEAIFVGEPSGSRPNFVGQSTHFTLPCCGRTVSCSSLYHQNAGISCDLRTWVEPDIVAEPRAADFANHRDAGMEAILKEIALYKP